MADEPLLIDEYQLLNPIASGSFTTVWEVIEKGGGAKHYAMKLLLPEALAESEQKAVLKHESKIAERLQHPNFVHFHKFVQTKKQCYIVMDYFRAPNLKSVLNADPISVQVRFQRLAEQMCQVLAYMHDQGFLHRDIKPDNILFNKSSEARLIDFSLSTRVSGAVAKMLTTKRGKMIQGTRTYIAPETINKEVPTEQTDMYSLGVTFFEALTGEPPFKGSSPGDLLKKHVGTTPPEPSLINRNVTPEMDRMIMRMLAKKPKDRHKSMHEVFSELRALRVYKEDVQELEKNRQKEDDEKKKQALDKAGRLDSRADAVRQQLSRENPEFAKQFEEERLKMHAATKRREQEQADRAKKFAKKGEAPEPEAKPTPRPANPAAQAPPANYPPQMPFPQPGGMPYGGMPMPYPGQGYPGAPYGAPQYGAPMPGYGMPQYGAPPQYGMPPYGTPGYPQQPYPQQPYPQQPYGAPPQQPLPAAPQGLPPAPGQIPAGGPQQPAPPRPQAPAPAAPVTQNRSAPPAQPQPAAPAGNYWQELPPIATPQQPAAQKPPAQKPAAAPRAPAPKPVDPNLPLMDQLPPVQ